MNDITDLLSRELDATAPPAPFDVDGLLRRGRRARSGHRLSLAVGTTTAALAIGGGIWALAPEGSRAADAPIATNSEGTESEAAATPAGYDDRGALVIADGWQVRRQIEDPVTGAVKVADFPTDHIDDSVALVLDNGNERMWVLAWIDNDDDAEQVVSGSTVGEARAAAPDFETWIQDRIVLQFSDPVLPRGSSEAAARGADGNVITKPGWGIVDQVADPAGAGSLAVDVSNGEKHQFFIWTGDGSAEIWESAPSGLQTFAEWVETAAVDLRNFSEGGDGMPGGNRNGGGSGSADTGDWPGVERDDLVSFDGDTLVALPGARIVDQRQPADVGDSFATSTDTSAVALVDGPDGSWFVLARATDDGDQFIAVAVGGEAGDTIEEFLDYARARYAEGGGGML